MKQLLSTLLLCVTCLTLSAQEVKSEVAASASSNTRTYVYTPGGQAVQVFTRSELSSSEIAQYDADCKQLFPNVTILSSASATYNCHNYAWHMTDGYSSEKYWMNPLTDSGATNLSKYWTNDNYEEVDSTSLYDKIIYYEQNAQTDANITHSAIVSNSYAGYYISKWGAWPLVRHLPNDVPDIYGTTKRYFKPKTSKCTTGYITCSNGQGEIGVNVAARYYIDSWPANSTRMEFVLESPKGDDAIEMGYAVVKSNSSIDKTITFTRVGIYEMYFRFYNKYNHLIGDYWFEPIVVNE